MGQISSMDSEELKEIKEKLMPFMVSECGRHDITRVYFMLTNILEESTELLFYGWLRSLLNGNRMEILFA